MRKGIMFSIILFFLAVTLTGLIAIQRSLISYRRERIYIEMRIKSLNNMYDSLIRDAGSTLDTSLRRAMSAAFSNVSSPPGIGLSEANETLKELVLDGTLDGVPVQDLMENATFPYWIEKIEKIGVLKGFYIDITLHTLEIKPYDSFNLLAEAKMNVNITDIQGVAALNRLTLVKKPVSIEGLEDPLYPLNTGGFMTNTIEGGSHIGNYTQLLLTGSGGCTGNCYEYEVATQNDIFPNFQNKILVVNDADDVANLESAKAVISENSIEGAITIPYVVKSGAKNNISEGMNVLVDVVAGQGRVWYIENFKEHIENSYYQPSDEGPSYLDRLEGKTEIQSKYSSQTINVIGLESFIKKQNIPPGVPVDVDKTNIDYLYFSSGPLGNEVKGISTVSNSFRIDDINGRQQNYSVDQIIE